MFSAVGISKGDVADYYRAVAPLVLAEIARRPLSLLRCPDGAGGDCFFQKHEGRHLGAHIKAIALKQKAAPRTTSTSKMSPACSSWCR